MSSRRCNLSALGNPAGVGDVVWVFRGLKPPAIHGGTALRLGDGLEFDADRFAPQSGDPIARQSSDPTAPHSGDPTAPQSGDRTAPQSVDSTAPQSGDPMNSRGWSEERAQPPEPCRNNSPTPEGLPNGGRMSEWNGCVDFNVAPALGNPAGVGDVVWVFRGLKPPAIHGGTALRLVFDGVVGPNGVDGPNRLDAELALSYRRIILT
jgi:hypothetical protein